MKPNKESECGFDAKRIARNTGFMYLRMAVTTAADLVAVRVVFNALGLEGYGVFSAVAGVVSALMFFNGALQNAAQRFLCFEFGKGGRKGLSETFSAVVCLTAALCALIVLVGAYGAEGFVRSRLSLPEGARAMAQTLCLFEVAVMAFRTLQLPFVALVVAEERMDFFAKVSVLEALLSLGVAGAVTGVPSAKPQAYAALLMVAAAVQAGVYAWYCRVAFREVTFTPRVRGSCFRELGGFFTWSAIGSVSGLLKCQGVCLLVNAYAGSVYNASWNAAMNVGGCLWGFVANFRQAYFPQIVKAWSGDGKESLESVTAVMLRWSFLLMAVLVFPLLAFTPALMAFWLGSEQPPEIVAFTRCVVVQFFFEALVTPLDTAILATGRIAAYQVGLTLILSSSYFLAWGALAAGLPPWTAVGAVALATCCAFAYRVVYMHFCVGVHGLRFLRRVFF